MSNDAANKEISGPYEFRINFLKLMKNESDEKNKLRLSDILSRYKHPRAKDFDGKTLSYGDTLPTRNTLLSMIEEFRQVIQKDRTDSNGNPKKEMYYYYKLSENELSEEEITILIRAVGALQCINGPAKVEIIRKLLTDKADSFRSICRNEKNVMLANQSYCSIDINILKTIKEALKENKRLQFNYFKYTYDKIKVRSSEKSVFEVEPVMLHIDSGYLYLVSFKAGIIQDALRIYRVDRMRNVRITDEIETNRSIDEVQFRTQSFHMYTSGKEIKVVIECQEDLASSMIDKFGDFKLLSHNGNSFIFEAKVYSGNTFYSWLTTFGGKVKLLEPQEEVLQYKEHLKNILSNYDN